MRYHLPKEVLSVVREIVTRFFNFAPAQYSVETRYLDYPIPTWSVGKGVRKFRVRRYNTSGVEWFEEKRRKGKRVVKERRPVSPADYSELREILKVSYRREAWESRGRRVTIDTALVFEWPDGKVQIGEIAGILELKMNRGISRKLRKELLPIIAPYQVKYGKYKFALKTKKVD
jgi:hypothetical protein